MVHYLQNHPKRWYGLNSEHRPLELELLKFQFLIQKTSYNLRKFFMARTVNCIKLGREAEGLDFPPYPPQTELGKRIWESVSKEAWAAWLKQQTMLVNENRLNLADLRSRQYLARQMENHFFGNGADAVQGYVPPSA
jgi:Fe-S cluster biosynthesis and repair protein YggX